VFIIRMSKLYYTASGIITPVGGRHVHRLREDSLNLCTRRPPSLLITDIKNLILFYTYIHNTTIFFRDLAGHCVAARIKSVKNPMSPWRIEPATFRGTH